MSTKAQALLNRIKILGPAEQEEICGEVIALRKLRQRQALERLRGATKGKNLLRKLLDERSRERAIG